MFLPDDNARAAALQSGVIDVGRVSPQLAEACRDDPRFQAIEIPSASIEQASLPNTNPVLAGPRSASPISSSVTSPPTDWTPTSST